RPSVSRSRAPDRGEHGGGDRRRNLPGRLPRPAQPRQRDLPDPQDRRRLNPPVVFGTKDKPHPFIMAGLDPAIHALAIRRIRREKAWIAGSSPVMTNIHRSGITPTP